jgi:hypothetical protein
MFQFTKLYYTFLILLFIGSYDISLCESSDTYLEYPAPGVEPYGYPMTEEDTCLEYKIVKFFHLHKVAAYISSCDPFGFYCFEYPAPGVEPYGYPMTEEDTCLEYKITKLFHLHKVAAYISSSDPNDWENCIAVINSIILVNAWIYIIVSPNF